MADDVTYMQHALQLAERGAGWASPNPMVGCVIIRCGAGDSGDRDSGGDVVLGQGWHARYGGAHAEVMALEDARAQGHDVRGATMYVTLEPCSHHGKTLPCAPVVVSSGVSRVVVATQDVNPSVAGRGLQVLRDAGVTVDVGVCKEDAQEQNRIFFHWMRAGLPYVTVKVAVSSDGYIAARIGTRTQISGEVAARFVHELRHRHDALLVGAGTVVVDDPELSVRGIPRARQPLRVVLDAEECTSPTARVYRDDNVLVVRERQPLEAVWRVLAARGVSSVLVEGGQHVLTECLAEGAVREWIMLRSPKQLGGGVSFVRDPALFGQRFRLVQQYALGDDQLERYLPVVHRPLAS